MSNSSTPSPKNRGSSNDSFEPYSEGATPEQAAASQPSAVKRLQERREQGLSGGGRTIGSSGRTVDREPMDDGSHGGDVSGAYNW
jgi:hypothetical protein